MCVSLVFASGQHCGTERAIRYAFRFLSTAGLLKEGGIAVVL